MMGVIYFLIALICFYPFVLGPWRDSEKHPRAWFWFATFAAIVLTINLFDTDDPWWLRIVRVVALVFSVHAAYGYRQKMKETSG